MPRLTNTPGDPLGLRQHQPEQFPLLGHRVVMQPLKKAFMAYFKFTAGLKCNKRLDVFCSHEDQSILLGSSLECTLALKMY